MDLVPSNQPNLSLLGKFRFPNVMIFPRELRDAIPPEHDSRALVFDSVSGSKAATPIPVSGMIDSDRVKWGARARIDFLVHETGRLDGKFTVSADLDAATTRALGQFLIDLANQAEK